MGRSLCIGLLLGVFGIFLLMGCAGQSSVPVPLPSREPLFASPTLPPPAETDTPIPVPVPRPRSGLRVVYVDSNRDLWIWDEGQLPKLLANTHDVDRVRLSGDGEWILFTRVPDGYSDDLWLVRPNGSEGKILLSSRQLARLAPVEGAHAVVPFQMRWINGTHKIAISSRPVLDGPELKANNDLILLDADSGEIKQLYTHPEGGVFFLSTDGRHIALVHPGRIDLINADGSGLRKGVLQYPESFNGVLYTAQPRWDSQGRRLRVLLPPASPDAGAPAELWEIGMDGQAPRLLNHLPAETLYSAAFSPDLSMLVYSRQPENGPEAFRELHLVKASGEEDKIFVTGQISFEQWSPDSARFIFNLGMPSKPHLGDLQGTDQGEIAPILTTQIRWVDDQRFLYLFEKAKVWQIRLARAGEEGQVLLSFPQVRAYPSFDFLP